MSALQRLREQVEKERAQRRAAEEASRQQALQQFQEWVVETLGEDVLEEFQAEFEVVTGGTCARLAVTLHYCGHQQTFFAATPERLREQVVEWTERVDDREQERARERTEVRKEILSTLLQTEKYDLDHLSLLRYKAERCDLLGDPEVAAALNTAQKRLEEAVARAEEERRQAMEAEIAKLLGQLGSVQNWSEWRALRNRIDYSDPYIYSDSRIREALEEVRERLEAQDEERERRRLEAQAQAFYPFRYYRVHYGVVAFDDGERYLDIGYFGCLRPEPNEDGWWYPVDDYPVRVANLIKVERIEVREPDEMPCWCPRQDTEWGEILVPPAEAERL